MINLIRGDCLEVMKTLPDKSVDLTITSPPYNMRTRIRNGEYTTREKTEHFCKKYSNFDDALPIDEYYKFHKQAIGEMMRISKVIFWNVQIITGSKEAVFKIIGEFNRQLKDVIIWDKGWGQPAMHEAVINRATELILIFESSATAGRAFSKSCFGRGTMEDIWRFGGGKGIDGNRACFPIELPMRAIMGWSNRGTLPSQNGESRKRRRRGNCSRRNGYYK
jgi:site-specific DNA-methyltransferase (adenine-specific)